MSDDGDRDAILSRRNRFITIALAGLTTAACNDLDPFPQPCLAPPYDPGEQVQPYPCLEPPRMDEDDVRPSPCLEAPVEGPANGPELPEEPPSDE